jgi:hypothetical protein
VIDIDVGFLPGSIDGRFDELSHSNLPARRPLWQLTAAHPVRAWRDAWSEATWRRAEGGWNVALDNVLAFLPTISRCYFDCGPIVYSPRYYGTHSPDINASAPEQGAKPTFTNRRRARLRLNPLKYAWLRRECWKTVSLPPPASLNSLGFFATFSADPGRAPGRRLIFECPEHDPFFGNAAFPGLGRQSLTS